MYIETAEKTVVEMPKRNKLESPLLWYDARQNPELVTRALQSGYNGLVLAAADLARYQSLLSDRLTAIVDITESSTELGILPNLVVASRDKANLRKKRLEGFKTAFRAFVDDAASLHEAIAVGREHDYVLMSFKDPTNIPLELVIASLQSSNTILVKEIEPNALEDALVTVGVMEVGADGVLFTPPSHSVMDEFLQQWSRVTNKTIELQVGEIVRTRPIGMGYRSCIDLVTLFEPTEGMLVGSTSQGGILCCPEVFHLPYMELRPFRVNAGGIHSYVYNLNNETNYMTELRAGSPVMVADANGQVRRSYVGRMKTEVRPLRLIEVSFGEGLPVNLLLQDDWHVRIYSDDVKPRNITELRPGDKVLGHVADPGRHVGIKVSEHILEN